ncbi:hypothetical protein BD560DRAFT_414555 [Blakeslea trispora]|nr:hypothetical protein BD560DRAFT_414555 [Blakeslea trispora]
MSMFSFNATKPTTTRYNKPSLAQFDTLDEAEEYAKMLAKSEGYCLSRRSSQLNATKGGRNVMLNCVQGGHYRATRQPSIKPKKRDSLKVGCKYSIRISEHAGKWCVRPPKNEHNHDTKDSIKLEEEPETNQMFVFHKEKLDHHASAPVSSSTHSSTTSNTSSSASPSSLPLPPTTIASSTSLLTSSHHQTTLAATIAHQASSHHTLHVPKTTDLMDQRLCLALYQIEHYIKSSNDINSLKELEAWVEHKYKQGGLYPH